MHRRFHANLASLTALALLCGGCAQMTRHSNMVVFGTNTVVGLRVGTNATQVPSIDLGYTRQEAVLMPVVANTGVTGGSGQGNQSRLVPCNVGTNVAVVAGTPPPPVGSELPSFATHPCLLVATDGREAKDSYSVLASFGADFGASSEPSQATARGGLAQYFATGMAAQLLALNGGAAVVATGRAAEAAALSPPTTLTGAAALVPTAADRVDVINVVRDYVALRDSFAAKVGGTAQADLVTRFKDFEGAIGGGGRNIMSGCASPAACAQRVQRDNYYFDNFGADPEKFNAAVSAWPN